MEPDVFDPLANLRDIHLPEAVSWWPPAVGWWLLLLALIVFSGFVARTWLRWYHSPRRTALHELRDLRDSQESSIKALRAMSVLLRRCALTQYPAKDIAGLIGEPWLSFLDQTGKTTEFSSGNGRVFGNLSYRRSVAYDMEASFALVDQWIREAMPSIRYES